MASVNSLAYYESNNNLLSMLQSKKSSGNELIDQIISDNEQIYQKKMESMGIYTSTDSKYKAMSDSADSLLDSISALSDESLYGAKDGQEYDSTKLLTAVSNYVAVYNSSLSSLKNCGGSLYDTFKEELDSAYSSNAKSLNSIGITADDSGKLSLNTDTLKSAESATVKDIMTGSYISGVKSAVSSIDAILSKALSASSSNYSSSGTLL